MSAHSRKRGNTDKVPVRRGTRFDINLDLELGLEMMSGSLQ